MDTSSSIHHRFDVEIPRGKFFKISSILKGEFTWKLRPRFYMDISTRIQLSKLAKYRWVLHVDCSRSWRQIDVYSLFPFYHFLTFSALGTYSKLSWYRAARFNFNDIDVITDIGTIGTVSFGNFATTQIIMNKDNSYLLQINTNKDYIANIYK